MTTTACKEGGEAGRRGKKRTPWPREMAGPLALGRLFWVEMPGGLVVFVYFALVVDKWLDKINLPMARWPIYSLHRWPSRNSGRWRGGDNGTGQHV